MIREVKGKKIKKSAEQPKNIREAPTASPKKHSAEHLKPHRWKKGDPSPNPTGRPRGSLCLTTALRKILSKKGASKKEKYIELMEDLLRQAKKGSPKLMALIFDRIDGKLPDHLLTTDTGPLSELDNDMLDKIINAGRNQSSDPE